MSQSDPGPKIVFTNSTAPSPIHLLSVDSIVENHLYASLHVLLYYIHCNVPLSSLFIFVIFFLRYFSFYIVFSCPEGQRRLGATQCIDEDECEYPGLCQNGAECINLSDSHHFRCVCTSGWTGRYCQEPAPEGAILVGGKDFIIVFVFCILSLIGKRIVFCFSCFVRSFLLCIFYLSFSLLFRRFGNLMMQVSLSN